MKEQTTRRGNEKIFADGWSVEKRSGTSLNYRIGWHSLEEKDEKVPLPKISLLVHLGGEIFAPSCSEKFG